MVLVASLGLERAGFTIKEHYFSEIDKHAIANYKYNFKNAKYIGSVTDIPNGSYRGIDIITFGSPCQDFSLAGKRAGLEGERSSLISHAIRLVADIRPNVFIWENVKGAFSSNGGADFWAIIQEFTNIGGYRLEWQLLNTKWLLPQNRERIYLVGHLGRECGSKVFPVGEDDEIFNRTTKNNKRQLPNIKAEYCRTITSRIHKMGSDDTYILQRTRGKNKGGKHEVCPTVSCNSFEQNNIVVKENYIQFDKSGKGYNSQQDRVFYEDGYMGTIPSSRTENKVNIITNDLQLRRLTEIECERVQGFPDNWTKFGNYNGEIKEIAGTNRYKMIGNAVTVDVVAMVGKKLINNTTNCSK